MLSALLSVYSRCRGINENGGVSDKEEREENEANEWTWTLNISNMTICLYFDKKSDFLDNKINTAQK